MTASTPVPVTLVAGYLGAGKTTLVNHVLRHAGGARLAVLVNDFGELPIDADLIVGRDGDVLAIAGGCICCSFGSDLVGALQDIAAMRPPPDHLVIETSGVALPSPVAATLSLIAGLALDGIVVLADAETVEGQSRDRYLADTIAAQLAAADLVVLNKCDLVDPDRLGAIERRISGAAPRARVVPAVRCVVPVAVLLGIDRTGAVEPSTITTLDLGTSAPSYDSVTLEWEGPVEPLALARTLAAPDNGLLRAKGHVRDGTGKVWSVQVVGARHEVLPATAAGDRIGRVVCIGLRGRMNRTRLSGLCSER